MSASPYKQLEQEFRRLHAFRGALALLRWDAAVMMPRGSADVRGEQLAALETEHHALLTAPRITRLLDRAQANTQGLADWQIANLHEMRRQRDHAIATPVTLVSRLTKAASRAESRWLEARAQGKFEAFAPYLEEVVHLVRDKAALLGQALNLAPYDALVDEFSPGLTTADIDAMFKALSRRLPSLIREAIAVQETRPLLPLTGKFPAGKQRALAVEVMKSIGFPFERGRLDESEQPFTEGVPGDIRVTTRFDPDDIFSGLLGALHETGHAMYDLGLPQDWRDQPVGRDRGMALEESQSLLIEMMVCRSRPLDRKSTRLNSSHTVISYAVFCLKKKINMCQNFVSKTFYLFFSSMSTIHCPHSLPQLLRFLLPFLPLRLFSFFFLHVFLCRLPFRLLYVVLTLLFVVVYLVLLLFLFFLYVVLWLLVLVQRFSLVQLPLHLPCTQSLEFSFYFFFLMFRRPPGFTLFPYTTLFR